MEYSKLPGNFWSLSSNEIFQILAADEKGLSTVEAVKRLNIYGVNLLKARKGTGWFLILIAQFKSPIILILIFAAIISFFLKDSVDGIIILAIIIISGFLSFWQEFSAKNVVEKLINKVKVKATILRNGLQSEIFLEEIAPGDIIILNAGDIIPADCLLLESKDLFVNESTLTGETFPVEKKPGILPVQTIMAKRFNCLFMGTNVVSGTANAIIVNTGKNTEFGKISERLKLKLPETEFEHSIKRFGYFLMEITLTLVFLIFAANIFLKKPVFDSFLFSLAIAVGLTPQLLPAIISVNLSRGAKRIAAKKVIVKRLSSIENLGSMNILCTDKTGTITEGKIELNAALDITGNKNTKLLLFAYLNSSYETGFSNPIDEAIKTPLKLDITKFAKLDEIPYDFNRKRLSILAENNGKSLMITKGSLDKILEICSFVENGEGNLLKIDDFKEKIVQRFDEFSSAGFRTLGLSYKNTGDDKIISKKDETGMIFLGFLTFIDKPKKDIDKIILNLERLGIAIKIITGDNRAVSANIGKQAGIKEPVILTGEDLKNISDEALTRLVGKTDIFAEVEPNQKEKIIIALKKLGNVVGYMGDGINDVSAMHAADVSISVDSAVDIAKETADIILLEKDLSILIDGTVEGRIVFANTQKYIYMATSANFGNMFSMAGASLFLPFLPLLPRQILLTNLLTDMPEMTIATDGVDAAMVQSPRRINIRFIRNFMIVFGLVSSIFDYITFGVLLWLMHATPVQFRTGWFLESVISAAIIVLVIRTRKPFFRSRPGKWLLISTVLVIIATVLVALTPAGGIFGFEPLPPLFILILAGILVLYIFFVEIAKNIFYRKT